MTDIEVVLQSGTVTFVECKEGDLVKSPLMRDSAATVFAMNDEWHIYDVDGVLHYVRAEDDR